MKNVVIYSTPTCHFCQLTKDFFKKNNVEYTDHDVSSDAEKRQEMIEKSGQMGVPVIFISDPSKPDEKAEMFVGFDEAKLSQALGL